MIHSKIFLTSVPALGVAVMLAQPVTAMTCAEFEAMDEDGQMQAVNDMAAELDGTVKEQNAPLDDDAAGQPDVEVDVDQASDSAAPRDEERAEDRGGEAIAVIREGCASDPDFDMTTVTFEAPKEK